MFARLSSKNRSKRCMWRVWGCRTCKWRHMGGRCGSEDRDSIARDNWWRADRKSGKGRGTGNRVGRWWSRGWVENTIYYRWGIGEYINIVIIIKNKKNIIKNNLKTIKIIKNHFKKIKYLPRAFDTIFMTRLTNHSLIIRIGAHHTLRGTFPRAILEPSNSTHALPHD